MTSSTGTSSAAAALPESAIAIIGMAGRFPGADTIPQFWRNLRAGTESIVTLTEDELRLAGLPEEAVRNPLYVRRAALMDGIDEFDADFFGFTAQAARMLDPQHRLFLQCAFHALEDAGYHPDQLDGSVGVYGASSASGYLLHNLMSHRNPDTIIGQGATFEMISLSLQNDKDHLATRVAHALNLRGSALTVQTACSSSLVAVHLACQAILNGECEMALAGAVSIRVPHRVGYWHEPGAMTSPTGACRPFDARADGTVFGSGVGIVVLKSLADAMEAGDPIHAVIRGSALNNDGAAKMNYAAPTAAGQADVIAEAHAVADVDAATITYVETHGTGTPLGDPIEIEGLRQAFDIAAEPRTGPCYLGSVKSNIGHLEVAAGIAALIKTILCLKHREIPPTLHYTSPNPELHLDNSPFEVRGRHGAWETDGVRRAGVSAFGVGGTNAHLVLEEAPDSPQPVGTSLDSAAGPQVLLLSARTADALTGARAALAAELSAAGDDLALPDVAFTLAGRHPQTVRLAAVVADRADAVVVLSDPEHENAVVAEAVTVATAAADDRVVFLFPGQGAQHVGMARGLYDTEPVFAEHVDTCVRAFDAELGSDLRSDIFEGTPRNLERTDRAQPALFTVEYALAKLIESYGVRPALMAGHSIGEYAAATVAGVFDVPTAVKAVSMRARLMHSSPRGMMVAVALSPEALAEHLTRDVDLAAVNDPGSCVVAGSEDAIRAFTERMGELGIVARRVRTSHAFHSQLMDPVIGEYQGFLSRLPLGEPEIPLLSNVSGAQLSAAEATNPAIWARQIRSTVRFADELGVLLSDPNRVLVEVGPGGTLIASAMRHPAWGPDHRAVRLMRHHAQNRDDRDVFLLALGQLWAAGIELDFTSRAAGRPRRRVVLPGYPFARDRHWVEHNAGGSSTGWSSGSAGDRGAASNAQPGSPGSAATGTDAAAQLEDSLARIWGQCLGVTGIDRNANFFELGGDSLIAISVAMTAAHEGLDLTPQDLYENQTVAALTETLLMRYSAGGLTRHSIAEVKHPPVPPNIAYFLESGLSDGGRWRIPLVLHLRSDVTADDVRAVLTAVNNHHDALRLTLARRAGVWEQHIADPLADDEAVDVTIEALPDDVVPGSPEQRSAVHAAVQDHLARSAAGPLAASFLAGRPDEPGVLVLSLHATACDAAARDILLTDIFTALGQRLAGDEIVLQPVATSWREWSQRVAMLAAHPAVLDSREFWLAEENRATLAVAEPEVGSAPRAADLARISVPLNADETAEIDDARRRLRLPIDELLLAALSRAVADTAGVGTISVDLDGAGRAALRPDVDLRRTIGWFTTLYPVVLQCDTVGGARDELARVHETLTAVPHHGIGYGVLRYHYAPTARALAGQRPADIRLDYAGVVPELPKISEQAPIWFDTDTALPVREPPAGLGHPIELRAYRHSGVLQLDWWHDTRRVDTACAKALASAFATALIGLARQAVAEEVIDDYDDELMLVDMSADSG